MNNKRSSVFMGLLFVAIGSVMLLNTMRVIHFEWQDGYPLILIVLSILSFISVANGNKGNAFWGTTLGSLGLFFFLRNYGFIDYFWYDDIWPIFLIAPGLGFITVFFFKPDDWGVLIPGGILTFIGINFFLDSLGVSWRIQQQVRDFWPLILVIIGIGLISNSIWKHKNE